MNYELAKQLKDAGFPQKVHSGPEGGTFLYDVYFPTLEELIESCEDDFSELVRARQNYWMAGSYTKNTRKGAPTPTEAVVGLWLELNSSQPPSPR